MAEPAQPQPSGQHLSFWGLLLMCNQILIIPVAKTEAGTSPSESSFKLIMVSEHDDECKVKLRLYSVKLLRQMRSLLLQLVSSHSPLRYQHEDLESDTWQA